MAEYTLAQGLEAKQRLSLLARICKPTTLALLERAGIKSGYRCLDVGSGGGEVTLDMARMVGPAGTAVGMDIDAVAVQLARDEAKDEGVSNVEFRVAGIESLSDRDYDLAYARFLLGHLSDPLGCLRAMVRATRRKGIVVVEDIEFSAAFSYPPNEALENFVRWSCETVRRRGGNLNFGLQLPAAMRAAGLEGITIGLAQPVLCVKEEKELLGISMRQRRPAMLAEGVVKEGEFDHAYSVLQALADDTESIIGHPRIWQVWGYKP